MFRVQISLLTGWMEMFRVQTSLVDWMEKGRHSDEAVMLLAAVDRQNSESGASCQPSGRVQKTDAVWLGMFATQPTWWVGAKLDAAFHTHTTFQCGGGPGGSLAMTCYDLVLPMAVAVLKLLSHATGQRQRGESWRRAVPCYVGCPWRGSPLADDHS